MVFPLEHPRWQRIRTTGIALYPHINAARPRPLDPARYLIIQTLWLVMISSTKERHEPRWRCAPEGTVRGRLPSMDGYLTGTGAPKDNASGKEKELGHLSSGIPAFYSGRYRDLFTDTGADLVLRSHLTRYRNLSFCYCCGRCAVGTTIMPGRFRADVSCFVANGLLSLYLVALCLDAKLGRPGQSGVG